MANLLSEKEFEDIVQKTKKVVLAAISRTLLSEFYEAIDDVAQDTYFRLYKSLMKNKFRGESKIETYVYTIARNESLRMNKKLLREKRKSQKIIDSSNEKDFIIDDDTANTDKIALETALEQLPIVYREVIKCAMDNMPTSEIASRLNIPQGTVKSRTKRGKDLLKKIMMEV